MSDKIIKNKKENKKESKELEKTYKKAIKLVEKKLITKDIIDDPDEAIIRGLDDD